MRITQLLASAHVGDATGDAARSLAKALRQRGVEASLYALEVDGPLRDRVGSIVELPEAHPADTTIVHFNLPSPLGDLLGSRAGRRVIVYHNLTPPERLLPFCPEIARLTALGRRQLEVLARAGTVDLAIGVSRYNTADLDRCGFTTTTTAPLFVDLGRYDVPPSPVLAAKLAAEAVPTFVTVGRVAPNKRIETFFKTAAYYLRYVSPNARFLVVGGTRGLEPYVDSLTELHTRLRLDRRVELVGRVSHEDLVAYYGAATAYLCTSVHEGFCAPLLEAMKFGLPIVARRAAAIPETLGDAGVLLDSGDPAVWAETIHRVTTDSGLRRTLKERGARRLRAFAPEKIAERWYEVLGVGDAPGSRPAPTGASSRAARQGGGRAEGSRSEAPAPTVPAPPEGKS